MKTKFYDRNRASRAAGIHAILNPGRDYVLRYDDNSEYSIAMYDNTSDDYTFLGYV